MEQDIFAAITANDKERVAQLIAADASAARARNSGGISALMQARYENRLEIVEVLRQAVGELDIFEAAALGDVARLNKVLMTDGELVKARSSDGFTPLHLACFFGQVEAADTLVRHGADTNAVSPNRIAVIHSAAASRNAALLKLVLHAGANPNIQQTSWLHGIA
jgi:ankyrin repeat protein